MARRKLLNKLIHINDIHESLFLINGSNVDYITKSGEIYSDYGNGFFYPKKHILNKKNGYIYVNITTKNNKQVSKRLHVLMASTFLTKENDNDIVMHLDNDKTNNNLNNLKWGSISENTKQAYADGLAKTDKGFNDSQSMAIVQFSRETQEVLNIFGSVSIASQETNVTKSGILYQAKHKVKNPLYNNKCPYFFRFLDEFQKYGFVL